MQSTEKRYCAWCQEKHPAPDDKCAKCGYTPEQALEANSMAIKWAVFYSREHSRKWFDTLLKMRNGEDYEI